MWFSLHSSCLVLFSLQSFYRSDELHICFCSDFTMKNLIAFAPRRVQPSIAFHMMWLLFVEWWFMVHGLWWFRNVSLRLRTHIRFNIEVTAIRNAIYKIYFDIYLHYRCINHVSNRRYNREWMVSVPFETSIKTRLQLTKAVWNCKNNSKSTLHIPYGTCDCVCVCVCVCQCLWVVAKVWSSQILMFRRQVFLLLSIFWFCEMLFSSVLSSPWLAASTYMVGYP